MRSVNADGFDSGWGGVPPWRMRTSEPEGDEAPGFVCIDRGATRAWIRRGLEPDAERLGLAGSPPSDAGWASGGRIPHPIVRLADGEHAVVREYRRGGALRHLNSARYFRGNRALEELRASERVRSAGVHTPEVLAAVIRREGIGYTAKLATRWIAKGKNAADWLADAGPSARIEMWAETGRQIARMHECGIAHPDLNLRNLLLSGGEVFLLDFDRARQFANAVPARRRRHDLRRLARSVGKIRAALNTEEGEALRSGYGAAWPASLRIP